MSRVVAPAYRGQTFPTDAAASLPAAGRAMPSVRGRGGHRVRPARWQTAVTRWAWLHVEEDLRPGVSQGGNVIVRDRCTKKPLSTQERCAVSVPAFLAFRPRCMVCKGIGALLHCSTHLNPRQAVTQVRGGLPLRRFTQEGLRAGIGNPGHTAMSATALGAALRV